MVELKRAIALDAGEERADSRRVGLERWRRRRTFARGFAHAGGWRHSYCEVRISSAESKSRVRSGAGAKTGFPGSARRNWRARAERNYQPLGNTRRRNNLRIAALCKAIASCRSAPCSECELLRMGHPRSASGNSNAGTNRTPGAINAAGNIANGSSRDGFVRNGSRNLNAGIFRWRASSLGNQRSSRGTQERASSPALKRQRGDGKSKSCERCGAQFQCGTIHFARLRAAVRAAAKE